MPIMLKINTKLEIPKNDVPQFEQAAIIKFLVKEKTPDYEIFCRLKKVYKRRVLSQEKVFAMANRFLHSDTYSMFEDCKDMVKLTVNENGDVFNGDASNSFDTIQTNLLTMPDGVSKYRTKSETEPSKDTWLGSTRKKLKSQKAYLQTEFKQEAPDIEVEYILENDEFESLEESSFLDEAVFENGIFDEDKIRGINLDNIRLPFLPKMTAEMATDVLMKLHNTYTCKLCDPKDFQFQSSLRRHLMMAHAKRTVTLDDQLSLRCRRSCVKDSKGHFHCSKCVMAFQTHRRLFVHFQRHFFKSGKPTSLLEANVIHTRCLCVDRDIGLFLVQKSDFGSMAPIHVQQNADVSRCSDLLCQKAMSIAIQQNNPGFKCKHLQRVSSSYSSKVELYDLDEDLLSPLDDSSQLQCIELLEFAKLKKVSPVVEWPVSEELIYYSVISKCNSAWCSRTMVKYFPLKGAFDCTSCNLIPCIHCHLVTLHSNYK